MAYTDQNIIDAYNQAMAGGATEAQFVERAQSMGISNDQLASARGQLTGGSSPAPTPAPAPQTDRFTDAQYSAARDWSNGKTWAEISQKGSDLGLTSAEMGKVFGNFGGSSQQVQNLTGYGTGATGFNPDGSLKWNTSFAGGKLADGSTPNDWKFDVVNGWTKVETKKPGTGAGMGMPTTGINLSQIQTATPWEVAKNQTVQSQLEQIIAADSPLMQQARMRALQAANARGLLNSSMAVSAGESALYDAAMPIAQQDASTYADAGRFNADAQNTFSRDNNAFVRDAFMADFNLVANEWAKKQDQVRELDKLTYQQKLNLERDAIQNGFTSARDAVLNGYNVARDEANNSFTLKRDENQNRFTASQNELDRQAAMSRVAAGQTADTSMARLAAQINADKDVNALKVKQGAREIITNERSKLAANLIKIEEAPGLSTDVKNQMKADVIDSYQTIVKGNIADAEWTAEDWNYKVTAAPAPAPAAASNVVQNVTQGGDGA